jgi:hypothetical protein
MAILGFFYHSEKSISLLNLIINYMVCYQHSEVSNLWSQIKELPNI